MKIDDNTWKFIEESLDLIKKQSDRLNKATEGLMIAPESPLIDTHGWIESRLVDALELLAGDDADTISWFVYDGDFGRDQLEATVDGEKMVIDSFTALRKFLASV